MLIPARSGIVLLRNPFSQRKGSAKRLGSGCRVGCGMTYSAPHFSLEDFTVKRGAVDKICGAASLKPLNVAFLQLAVPKEKRGLQSLR